MLTPEQEAGLRAYIAEHGEDNITTGRASAWMWKAPRTIPVSEARDEMTNAIAACEAAGIKIEVKE